MENRRRPKKTEPKKAESNKPSAKTIEAKLLEMLGPPPDVDWSTIDFVVGTREDVTHTGINRPCARCKQAVYTSRRYPIAVALVCEYCALELVDEDRKSGKSYDDALPFASGGDWAADPWRRGTGRPAPKRGTRKLGTPPGPRTGQGTSTD